MKNFVTIILIFIIGSCDINYESPKKFILRVKDKDLSLLFNVSIEARNERNDTLHYYYSHTILKDDILTIPSFEYFDDFYKEDSITYNKIFIKLCKYQRVNESLYLINAKAYAKQLDKVYKELGVINFRSNPKRGRSIEFTLDEKCTVYYLEDATTLTPYWKDKFSKMQKVDEKWYYECN